LTGQGAQLAAAGDLEDRLALARNPQPLELRRDLRQGAAERTAVPGAQQRRRRRVDDPDMAIRAHRQHARRHPGQHRLDQRTPAVGLVVRGDQRAGLLGQAPGHAVERHGERADLVMPARHRHAGGEVALTHPPRRADQLAHRPHDTIRHRQRDPDRRAHDQQRHQQQRGVEAQLQRARAIEQRIIFGERVAPPRELPEHQRLHIARRVQ
jgi:hypothetical protein